MKDKLEQFIDDNRESFDYLSDADSGRMWERIEKQRKSGTQRKIVLRYFSRIAAAVLIFGLSYAFHEFMDNGRNKDLADDEMNSLYEQLPELAEAENYYTNLISGKMEEIKPFLASNPGIGEGIKVDLTELDSIYISLKNDLKDNVANEQIIEAMIQNYRLKLQILEELQSVLKQENKQENEKEKVAI